MEVARLVRDGRSLRLFRLNTKLYVTRSPSVSKADSFSSDCKHSLQPALAKNNHTGLFSLRVALPEGAFFKVQQFVMQQKSTLPGAFLNPFYAL